MGWAWSPALKPETFAQRLAYLIFSGLLLNLFLVTGLALLGWWTSTVDWLVWGFLAGWGVGRYRRQLLTRAQARPTFQATMTLLALLILAVIVLPLRSEWLAGGWDPGLYQNNAVAIAQRDGWRAATDTLHTDWSLLERAQVSDLTEWPYAEIMPGVPLQLQSGHVPIYFFPLNSLTGAWLYRIGGLPLLYRLPGLLMLLGAALFWAFCQTLYQRRAAWLALGWMLISPLWWYQQAVPTAEPLYLLLLYGLLLSYTHARLNDRPLPWLALLGCTAAVLNHLNALIIGVGLLVVAAAAETLAPRPYGWHRLAGAASALVLGLWINLGTAWVTISRLQEKEAALSWVLALTTAGLAILVFVVVHPYGTSMLRLMQRHLASALRLFSAGLIALTLLVSLSGFSADGMMWNIPVPLLGSLLTQYAHVVHVHGVAWFYLVAAGCWTISYRPAARSTSVLLLALGIGSLLLLAYPGITPIYPWALRRFLILLLPWMALAMAMATNHLWHATDDRSRVPQLALAFLIGLAAITGLKESRSAMRVGDYRGLTGVLDELVQPLRSGDIVIVDDARWGTPLFLAYGHAVINGALLQDTESDDALTIERLDALLQRQRPHRPGRIWWLTSTAAGLEVFPELPHPVHSLEPTRSWDYRTVVHGSHQHRFAMETRQAVFQWHEMRLPQPPTLTTTAWPGPVWLLTDDPSLHAHLADDAPTPASAWRAHLLPAGFDEQLPLLQSAFGQPSSAQHVLHHEGQPLEFILYDQQIHPGSAHPALFEEATRAVVFPLPLSSPAAVRITLSPLFPTGQPLAGRLSIDDIAVPWEISGARPVFTAVIEATAQPLLRLDDMRANAPPVRLEMLPLYTERVLSGYRDTVLLFETHDDEGHRHGTIAHHVPPHQETIVAAPAGQRMGALRAEWPLDTWHTSNLSDDAWIQFHRFHAPEPTGDPERPYQRWTEAEAASIQLPALAKNLALDVTVRFRDVRPPTRQTMVSDRVHFNGTTHSLSWDEGIAEVDLRASAHAEGMPAPLEIQSDTWIPARELGSTDRRRLGLLIDDLRIRFQLVPPDSH